MYVSICYLLGLRKTGIYFVKNYEIECWNDFLNGFQLLWKRELKQGFLRIYRTEVGSILKSDSYGEQKVIMYFMYRIVLVAN